MNQPDEILERIGSNLRRIRTKKGLSLRELSYLCNIDNSKIAKIEQGKINITVRTLMELCTGLEVLPGDLLKSIRIK